MREPGHLFLGDRSANVQDMLSKGRSNYRKGEAWTAAHPDPAIGERNPRAILTASDALEVINLAAAGRTIASLARDRGVSEGCIRHIVKRRNWQHLEIAS